MAADPLAALAGLHWPAAAPLGSTVPETVALAAAGGLVAGLAFAGLAVLAVGAPRPASPRAAALEALSGAGGLDPDARLAAIARLLRTYGRAAGGPDFASVEGEAWLGRLDVLFGTDLFTTGAGRLVADGLYRPQTAAAVAALDGEIRRLLGERRR